MERSIAIDVEGSNESATEDPSVGGSGEEELETSEVSAAARRRFRRGAVAGITCGDVTGKDGAWTRHLVRCGGGDSAVRLERSRLRLRRAFRLVSNSKAGVGSMVGEPSAGRESAALHFTARPEASKASAAALATEREKGSQREVSSTSR